MSLCCPKHGYLLGLSPLHSFPDSFTCNSRDSSVNIDTDYELDDRGFESRPGLGIFLFDTASRTDLGSTQPPIQRIPGTRSLGVNRPRREAGHSPPSSAEVKECMELHFHTPTRLHRNFTFTFTFTIRSEVGHV
jgi:hypothetical protein